MAKPPHWLTKAFSLVERDDLMVNLDQLTTLQKVRSILNSMHALAFQLFVKHHDLPSKLPPRAVDLTSSCYQHVQSHVVHLRV